MDRKLLFAVCGLIVSNASALAPDAMNAIAEKYARQGKTGSYLKIQDLRGTGTAE